MGKKNVKTCITALIVTLGFCLNATGPMWAMDLGISLDREAVIGSRSNGWPGRVFLSEAAAGSPDALKPSELLMCWDNVGKRCRKLENECWKAYVKKSYCYELIRKDVDMDHQYTSTGQCNKWSYDCINQCASDPKRFKQQGDE